MNGQYPQKDFWKMARRNGPQHSSASAGQSMYETTVMCWPFQTTSSIRKMLIEGSLDTKGKYGE